MSHNHTLGPHRKILQLAVDREEGELSEMDSPASSRVLKDGNRSNATQNHRGANRASIPSRTPVKTTQSPPKGPRSAVNTNYRKFFHSNTHSAPKISSNPSSEKVMSTPLKSVPAMRENAKQFVKAWHHNGYTFSQLVGHDIDANFIRNLYIELGLDTSTKIGTLKPTTAPNFNSRDPKLPPKPPAIEDNASKLLGQPNLSSGPTNVALPVLPELSKETSVDAVPKSSNISDLPRPRLDPPKAMLSRPLETSTGGTRASTMKPQSIVGNRQDYIARLNAAKTKKSANQTGLTTSVQSDVSKSSHQTGAKLPIMSETLKPTSPVQSNRPTPLNGGSTMSETADAPMPVHGKLLNNQPSDRSSLPHSAKPEAMLTGVEKRKAQTELARLRMQALIAAKARQTSAIASPRNSPQPKPSSQSVQLPEEERHDLAQNVPEKVEFQQLEVEQPPYSPSTQPGSESSSSESSTSVVTNRTTNKVKISDPVTVSPQLAAAKDVTMPNIVTSRIPGLFMTSPSLAQTMEMPLVEAEVNTTSPAQTTIDNSVTTLARKRPVASDFDNETAPQSHKRPFGRPRNSEDTVDMIIQVSDYESSDDEAPGSSGAVISRPSALAITPTVSTEPVGVRSVFLSYPDPFSVGNIQPTGKTVSGQESGVTTPLLTLSELQVRENRISLMKKRIAEMEQKRKAKSLTSGLTTPGTPRNDDTSVAAASSTTDQEVSSHAVLKATLENTQPIPVALIEENFIEDSRKDAGSDTPIVNVEHQKTLDLSPIAPSSHVVTVTETLGHRSTELENQKNANSPVRNNDLMQKQRRLEMLKQQVRELQEAIERAATDAQMDEESQSIATGLNGVLHNEARPGNENSVDTTKNVVLPVEADSRSHTKCIQAPSTDSTSVEELPSTVVVMTSMEESLPLNGVNYPASRKIDDHSTESARDEDADDADDSMSLDDSSEEDEAPSPVREPSDASPVSKGAFQNNQDQRHESELSDVEMPDNSSGTSEDEVSNSSYDPENKSPSSSLQHSPSIAPATEESSIELSQRGSADAITHLKTVDNGTSPSPPGTDGNDLESVDEDEYEPPDADLAPTASQKVNGVLSSHHDSDSDYEPPEAVPPEAVPPEAVPPEAVPPEAVPPDAVPPIQPSDTNLQVVSPVTANDKQQVLKSGPQSTITVQEFKSESFTQYESPLAMFKSFRFHPGYTDNVAGGIRSLTYSHNIDQEKQLCAYESAGGVCNDPHCDAQHFRTMAIGDNEILKQIGISNPGRTEAERQEYVQGLRGVVSELRSKNIKDAATVASEIFAYRRRFLEDPTKVLSL